MRNFKRDILAEFIEKDEKIRKLYNQIKGHPNHKRKLIVEESVGNKKGKIMYGQQVLTIEMDIALGDESILILAHELMHYFLVLKIPVPVTTRYMSKFVESKN